ncbi:hypothetical protein [Mycobacterium europaeum]|uniref:hypothetical protein n=1 Tax=Mycobacterium europaeum TaxID=761804 RepID=UPI001146F172|nr:hypothetical protein [Mycobacterium europaeum]
MNFNVIVLLTAAVAAPALDIDISWRADRPGTDRGARVGAVDFLRRIVQGTSYIVNHIAILF